MASRIQAQSRMRWGEYLQATSGIWRFGRAGFTHGLSIKAAVLDLICFCIRQEDIEAVRRAMLCQQGLCRCFWLDWSGPSNHHRSKKWFHQYLLNPACPIRWYEVWYSSGWPLGNKPHRSWPDCRQVPWSAIPCACRRRPLGIGDGERPSRIQTSDRTRRGLAWSRLYPDGIREERRRGSWSFLCHGTSEWQARWRFLQTLCHRNPCSDTPGESIPTRCSSSSVHRNHIWRTSACRYRSKSCTPPYLVWRAPRAGRMWSQWEIWGIRCLYCWLIFPKADSVDVSQNRPQNVA